MLIIILICCLVLSASSMHHHSCKDHDVCQHGSRHCPHSCPRIMNPICAYDGQKHFKYFYNECELRLNRCRTGTDWTESHMSLCLHQLDHELLRECLRSCSYEFKPVCASNVGKMEVFGNECIFNMENCFANGKWSKKAINECNL